MTRLTPKKRPYRRCVRFVKIDGDWAVFNSKSWSREGLNHKQMVNLLNGRVHCDCEHFIYRLLRKRPNAMRPDTMCFHIKNAVRTLVRRGIIELPGSGSGPK